MSKHYPNCLQDGFRTEPNAAYVIAMHNGRFFFRVSNRRTLTAWHWCGARLYTCFNDAKVQADKLRARGRKCIVRRLDCDGWILK